jgi:hypothetical protein
MSPPFWFPSTPPGMLFALDSRLMPETPPAHSDYLTQDSYSAIFDADPTLLDGTLSGHPLLNISGDPMTTAHDEFGWKANISADVHDHFQIPSGRNEKDNASFFVGRYLQQVSELLRDGLSCYNVKFRKTGVLNTNCAYQCVSLGLYLLYHGTGDYKEHLNRVAQTLLKMQSIAPNKMGKWLYHLSCGMERNNFGPSHGEMAVYKESDGPPLDDYYSNSSDSDSSGLAAKRKALIVAAEQEEKKYQKQQKKARKTL